MDNNGSTRLTAVPSDVDGRPTRRGPTPCQAPTLTELEEARAGVEPARQQALEGLMASDDVPDVEVLLAELVNRPAWHRSAVCGGADPDLLFPLRGDGCRPVEALTYFEECSVRPQCLASALEVASTVRVGWDVRPRSPGPQAHRGAPALGRRLPARRSRRNRLHVLPPRSRHLGGHASQRRPAVRHSLGAVRSCWPASMSSRGSTAGSWRSMSGWPITR